MAGSRGNGRGKFTVEYELGDLLMIADAMSSSVTRSMIYNEASRRSAERFRELLAVFDEMSPIPRNGRTGGYEFYNACSDIKQARTYGVHVVRDGRWGEDGKVDIVVTADGASHRIAQGIEVADVEALVADLEETFEEISGMETVLLSRLPCSVAAGTEYVWNDDGDRAQISETLDRVIDHEGFPGVRELVEIREMRRDYESRAEDGRRVYEVVLGVPSRCRETVGQALAADLQEPGSKPGRKQ